MTTPSDGSAIVRWTLGTRAEGQTVTARVDGLEPAVFSATARAGEPATVQVTPHGGSVRVGETLQHAATLRDSHGNAIAATVQWSSTRSSVATVDPQGRVTGVGTGSAQIRASFGSLSGSAPLTVTPAPVIESPRDEPSAEEPAGNGSGQSTAPARVGDLRVSAVTTGSVTLRFTAVNDGSGNPAHYQIRSHPTPIGWAWGEARPVESGTCAGEVTGGTVGGTVTCVVEGLQAGTSYDFQLVAYRGRIREGAVVYGPLSNSITGTTVASTGSGQNGGSGSGGTGGGGGSQEPSGTISVNPTSVDLNAIGATSTVTATARTSAGSVISSPGFTWRSSNEGVATVSSSGRITARGVGTAVITLAAACCSSVEIPVRVSVEVAAVEVSASRTSLQIGETLTLQAVTRDPLGNPVASGGTVSWNSSNSNVVQVSSSGVVTARGSGSAQVSASVAGVSSSVSLQVAGAPAPGGGGAPTNLPLVRSSDFSRATSGWYVLGRDAQPTFVSDATGPRSGPGVLQFNFPAGFRDGLDSGVAYTSFRASEVVVRLWFKVNPDWQHHGNNFKHVFLLTNGRRIYSNFTPGGYVGMINNNDDGIGGTPNIGSSCRGSCVRASGTLSENARVRRGEWQLLEIHGRMNGDGTARIEWWVDGHSIGSSEREQVNATQFTEFNIVGTWGGGGSSKSSTDWIRYDHVEVYAR